MRRFFISGLLATLVCVSLTAGADDDYVWLRVDGKYIRTSPLSDPPNEIWMGMGVAWTTQWDSCVTPDLDKYDSLADLTLDLGANVVRLGVQFMPYPEGYFTGQGTFLNGDIQAIIDEWLVPIFNMAKERQLYVIIENHGDLKGSSSCCAYDRNIDWSESTIQKHNEYWRAIADHFKDEPWVLGYEVANEPAFLGHICTPVRDMQVRALKAIREVDTRHIVILACSEWSSPKTMECVWSPVNFKPDEPHNQVIFQSHWYPTRVGGDAGSHERFGNMIRSITDKWNITQANTEWGVAYAPGFDVRGQQLRDYEEYVCELQYEMKLLSTIWRHQDGFTNSRYTAYEDIWVDGPYGTKKVASPPPKPSQLAVMKAEQSAFTVRTDRRAGGHLLANLKPFSIVRLYSASGRLLASHKDNDGDGKIRIEDGAEQRSENAASGMSFYYATFPDGSTHRGILAQW